MISKLSRFSLTAWCLCLGLSHTLHADIPHLDVIGFSPDGRYFAFEQYGFNEGQGVPYSNMYFVDVERNAYVTKPIIHEAKNDDPKADIETLQARVRNRNRIFSQNIFEDLKLHYPLPGQRVIHHPVTDLGVKNNQVSFTPDIPFGGLSYDKYDLDLSFKQIDEGKNLSCHGMGKPKIFKLTLTHSGGQQQVLQEDKRLPPSRGCPLNYRIQDVYWYSYQKHNYIAVFINVISAGFEGEDMRYLVVTAEVKAPKVRKNPKITLPPRPQATPPKVEEKPAAPTPITDKRTNS